MPVLSAVGALRGRTMSTARTLDEPAVAWATITIVCALVFFVDLGAAPLWDPDEGSYAEM